MATKLAVLAILERHRERSVSGEEIARALQISRNAVWRAIGALRRDGYGIEAVTNRGYRLLAQNDLLSVQGILPFLKRPALAEHIHMHETVGSTNQEAKMLSIRHAPHGSVVIANAQTDGKGRNGRAFFSPADSGLYMSFLLYPHAMNMEALTLVTAYAALSVCEAIEAVSTIRPQIKWVNDIFVGGKKAGGILTEALTEVESSHIASVIPGIGLNVTTLPQAFPAALRATAGSLYPDGHAETTRNRLAAEIINRMLPDAVCPSTDFLARYRDRLFMLGTEITVQHGLERYAARAVDIDRHGHLLVQKEDGSLHTLASGEISVW